MPPESPTQDPMKQIHKLLSLALLATAAPALATAQTFTLEPSADGTLYEDLYGDYASGAGPTAFVGDNAGGEIRRALMRFDMSALPPGATVTSATLEFSVLQLSPGGPGTRTLQLHRVFNSWSEGLSDAGEFGGSGDFPMPGDATWIHRSYPNTVWGTPGGDHSTFPSATRPISSVQRIFISTSAMASDVQNWVDNPGMSYGWMLKMADESGNTAIRIATKENLVIAQRPKLIVSVQSLSYFCDPNEPNSTGLPTRLVGGFGFSSETGFHMEVYDGPPNQFGYFLVGTGSNDPGISLGSGRFCLATGGTDVFGRYNVSGTLLDSIGLFDASGQLQNVVGTSTTGTGFDVPSALPLPGSPMITAGSVYHFQLWHREDNGGSNFSRGVTVNL